MESTNPKHKIDDLGRVLIPKDVRAIMQWETGDNLEVVANPENGTVTLSLSAIND